MKQILIVGGIVETQARDEEEEEKNRRRSIWIRVELDEIEGEFGVNWMWIRVRWEEGEKKATRFVCGLGQNMRAGMYMYMYIYMHQRLQDRPVVFYPWFILVYFILFFTYMQGCKGVQFSNY